jgi:hypothetical protein
LHDPAERGWVSLRRDDHWENHQIRSRAFILFLNRLYYRETGEAPAPTVFVRRWSSSKRWRSSMVKSARFTCGLPSVMADFISISATLAGGADRSPGLASGRSAAG